MSVVVREVEAEVRRFVELILSYLRPKPTPLKAPPEARVVEERREEARREEVETKEKEEEARRVVGAPAPASAPAPVRPLGFDVSFRDGVLDFYVFYADTREPYNVPNQLLQVVITSSNPVGKYPWYYVTRCELVSGRCSVGYDGIGSARVCVSVTSQYPRLADFRDIGCRDVSLRRVRVEYDYNDATKYLSGRVYVDGMIPADLVPRPYYMLHCTALLNGYYTAVYTPTPKSVAGGLFMEKVELPRGYGYRKVTVTCDFTLLNEVQPNNYTVVDQTTFSFEATTPE